MQLRRLYLENFVCYEHAFVDFSEFSSALIVGKQDNNDMYSNGVGKTTIFNALKYVFFNQSDVPLENIIRDDTQSCRVVLDFAIDSQEYRLARSRTKKGSTDLTLLQRNAEDGDVSEIYHTGSLEKPLLGKTLNQKYWKDLSGSRASDTEKDLAKLIKINHKSFESTVLFPQNDLTGLPTATPEKRKAILKEALNLIIYTKLEKLAKEKSSALNKELEKVQVLLDNLGNPETELIELHQSLHQLEMLLTDQKGKLLTISNQRALVSSKIESLQQTHSDLENKFANYLSQEKSLLIEKNKSEISVKEYQTKKSNVAKAAKLLLTELDNLKTIRGSLLSLDFGKIEILTEQISSHKEKIAGIQALVHNYTEQIAELRLPLPQEAICKHCRQSMSEEHRAACQEKINQEIKRLQLLIQRSQQEIASWSEQIARDQKDLSSLHRSKQELDLINSSLSSKDKEFLDKKSLHEEYVRLFEKHTAELKEKNEQLALLSEALNSSARHQAETLKNQIEQEKEHLSKISQHIEDATKEINSLETRKAITSHSLEQKKNQQAQKEGLKAKATKFIHQLSAYPAVIQAFSSTGIPNLIIQTVLDDLQIEANNLLDQLKPGLQLSFFTEKTKGDGEQADTLDIKYFFHGKERYFKQLSGGYQLAVSFALKLGLSFLLQKMIGTDLKFLLLDEIDQSLDKASVDAFVDIVKFFQKDFTILIITHNDRLKDKFSHAILVDQDQNMVSRAKVVSQW